MTVTTQAAPAAVDSDYFAIALTNLRLDTTVSFDLYLPSEAGNRPALYRHRDLPFTDDVRDRLLEHNVDALWVSATQETIYHRYMEETVRAALTDASLTPREKTQILYATSSDMIREFLADPTAKDVIPRTQHMVGAAVDHMLAEEHALANFLKTASLDYRTYTHSVNVAMYALHLAQRAGVTDPKRLQDIGVGTFLHDIGKCHIPEAILNKRGKLSSAEWRIIRKHPLWGCQILTVHGVRSPVILEITRDHHEKLDGSGYPFGVSGDSIPDYVRMTTICDVFDALSTKRVYKDEMPSFHALEIMKTELAAKLDRDLFATFIQMLHIQPN